MNSDFLSKLRDQISQLKNQESEWESEKLTISSKILTLQKEEEQWLNLKDALLSRLHILRLAADAEPSKRQEILSQLSSQPDIQLTISDSNQNTPRTPSQNSKIKFNDKEETELGSNPNNRSSPLLVSPKMLGKKIGKELKRRKSSNPPKVGSPKPQKQNDGFEYIIKWSLSQHLDCVRCVAFHPTLPYIATGSDDGSIRITNLDPQKKTKTRSMVPITSLRGHSGAILSMASYHNNLISGDVNGQVCVWNFSEIKSLLNESYGCVDHHIKYFTNDHKDAVWSIATHEDSPYFVTSSSDGTIRIHDIEKQQSTPISISDGPTVASFNLDGSMFVVGCLNGHVKVFQNKQESGDFNVQSYVISICPSTSKNEMYIATEDKNIKLLNITNGTITKQFIPHELYTSGMSLNSDGRYLITTSPDKTIRVWDSDSLKLLSVDSHHREKYGEAGLCVATTHPTNSHDFFASGGADGVVKVFVRNK